MFEEKRTLNGLKVILPLMERNVKKPQTIPPLERLKALRKLQRLAQKQNKMFWTQ